MFTLKIILHTFNSKYKCKWSADCEALLNERKFDWTLESKTFASTVVWLSTTTILNFVQSSHRFNSMCAVLECVCACVCQGVLRVSVCLKVSGTLPHLSLSSLFLSFLLEIPISIFLSSLEVQFHCTYFLAEIYSII